ncbi:sigma factor-like helix-turn-helix DNA-binding protein [Streptomyces sp. NPDC052016]|uniref:sigma factor-like helix-turn-helix DNA-binding protein n=1 Tax=Streptomyces sp. NPDC052016 TaxID=3365680 RepID=UPI0037D84957
MSAREARSQVSCTASSASASEPSMRWAMARRRGRSASKRSGGRVCVVMSPRSCLPPRRVPRGDQSRGASRGFPGCARTRCDAHHTAGIGYATGAMSVPRAERAQPRGLPGFDDGVVLLDLLAALPQDRREAFVLTQLLGLPYSEAAERSDCPVGTVRSRVARARATPTGLLLEADEPAVLAA